MIKTSNKAVLERNFSNIISYVSSCQKWNFFFVKRKMPVFFSVICERANLFSVKRDLDPCLPTLPSSL